MEIREKKLKEIFKDYNISTLNSISYVLDQGKSKNKDMLEALADAYSNKSDYLISDNSEEASIKDFSLDEVKASLINMPDYAADVIYKEVKKSFFKIQSLIRKSTKEEDKKALQNVLDKISEFINFYKETEKSKDKLKEEIRAEYIDKEHSTWIDDNYSDVELESFFNKFDVIELGKIHECFCCAFDYFSHRFFNKLNEIQYDKYERIKNGLDSLNGKKRAEMFDFNYIVDKLDQLTDKELELLKRGSIDSLNFSLAKSKVDSDFDDGVKGFTYLSDSILKEEKSREKETNSLTRLFKKFDRYDQMVLRIIFEYATNYELDKEKEMIDELITKPREKNLVQSKKLSSLTNKELNYLLELAENALSVLSIEFHAELDAELNAVYNFEERLVEEIGLRESSKGKFNDLNVNKKKTKKRKNVKKM
jgi:hypothetical protein